MRNLVRCGLVAVLASAGAWAQQVPITPLAKVDAAAVLTKQAAEKPHVLFVNVDQALDEANFREAVAAVSLLQPVNLAVMDAKGLNGLNPLDRDARRKQVSPAAKLVIYVVNNPKLVAYLSVPRQWAVINLHGLDNGLPKEDPERYRRRMRQMMLKGLALACGAGANFDQRCVMYQGSFTAEGIDQTSLSYSPFVMGPMQEALSLILPSAE